MVLPVALSQTEPCRSLPAFEERVRDAKARRERRANSRSTAPCSKETASRCRQLNILRTAEETHKLTDATVTFPTPEPYVLNSTLNPCIPKARTPQILNPGYLADLPEPAKGSRRRQGEPPDGCMQARQKVPP